MDDQKRLWQTVSSARRSLLFEQIVVHFQKGLLYAVLSAIVIYFISRLFVLPYYSEIALILAVIAFLLPFVFLVFQRPSKKQALTQLDQYFQYNELITVLTAKEDTPLIENLRQKAVLQSGQVLERFKKRPKQLVQMKILSLASVGAVILLVLFAFPAATQQEAKIVEDEREIIKEMKDDVTEQEKKPIPEHVEKQLAELQELLKEAETSEEALKELVKKQKELKKLESELAEQANGETNDGLQSQLQALEAVNKELAKSAADAQTAMSKIGKRVDLNTQKTIADLNKSKNDPSTDELNNNGNEGSNSSSNSSGNGQQSSGSNSNGQSTNGQQNNSGSSGQQNNSGTNQNPSNSGQGQGGQGQGQGGQGSQGQSGSGSSGGKQPGQGTGLQGGIGSGGRELVAIPKRIGEDNGQTVDSGKLGEGENDKEKGPVPATKGEVRPYEEVIGSYKDSYMQSADRLQLPSDLQQIVQKYYTTIEQ